MEDGSARILPAHIEQTVAAIARLHAAHERDATALQRFVSRMSLALGRPQALWILALLIVAWIMLNLISSHFGWSIDPAPFNWMQGALSVASVYITMIILGTQQRDDVIAGHREQLTLELAILGEQKSAKIIELLESQRRDNPLMANRIDDEATAMSVPADPQAVLEAIQDSSADPSMSDETSREGAELDSHSPNT